MVLRTKVSDSLWSCKIAQLQVESIALNRSHGIRESQAQRWYIPISRTKSSSEMYLHQVLHFQGLWWVTAAVNLPVSPGILEPTDSQGSHWSQAETCLHGHVLKRSLCSHGCLIMLGRARNAQVCMRERSHGTAEHLLQGPGCSLRWMAQGRWVLLTDGCALK